MALVFAPEPPLDEWFSELDDWCKRSPGYFVGRPIILDVSALPLDKEGLSKLIADLSEREIRIMGVEGTKASWLGLGMPPLVSASRAATGDLPPPAAAKPTASAKTPAKPNPLPKAAAKPAVSAPEAKPTASYLHDVPVRSGQSVIFPEGDLTIVGSVASGAEVVAGGSIHVYGALRGRAIAGSTGNPAARIFCHKLEAELIAIDGLYRTADQMDPQFRGRPVQAWLDGETMSMATLN
jgi:septum site-determining protein MinC